MPCDDLVMHQAKDGGASIVALTQKSRARKKTKTGAQGLCKAQITTVDKQLGYLVDQSIDVN